MGPCLESLSAWHMEFQSIRRTRLSTRLLVEVCVVKCLSLTLIESSVNDWICDAFRDNIKSCKAIVPSTVPGFEKSGFGRVIELSTPISLLQAILLTKSFLGLSTGTNQTIV